MDLDQHAKRRLERASLAVAVGIFAVLAGSWIARHPTGGAALFVELPLLAVIAFLLAGKGLSRSEEIARVRLLFLAALAVRIVLLVSVHVLIDPNAVAPDQVKYHLYADVLARRWHGEIIPDQDWFPSRKRFYDYLCAVLYWPLGSSPMFPKVLNAVCGAFTAAVAYRLARRFMSEKAALWGAMLAAFFPSLVLWSVLQVRDSLAILALVLAIDSFLELREGPRPGAMLSMAASVGFLFLLRDYMGYLIAGSLVAGWFAGGEKNISARRFVVTLTLLLLFMILLRQTGLIQPLEDTSSLEKFQVQRENLAVGTAAFGEESDISTLGGALLHLPVGMIYFLLAPFPWSLGSARQVLAIPESYLWYLIFPAVLIGFVRCWRSEGLRLMPLAAFMASVTASYSLMEGNIGTAYRHRAQVLVFFFIFAGAGLEQLAEKWRERRYGAQNPRPSTGPEGTESSPAGPRPTPPHLV